MPADRLHLVRHGEVHNPRGVLYGRLPGYRLSARGRAGAQAAADYLRSTERPVEALICSPLQRTQESAEPIADLFDLEQVLDERVIEPTNVFEGKVMRRALLNPFAWSHLTRPSIPGWGEPYLEIVARMDAAMQDAYASVRHGDVVIVSHQLPIWVTHLAVAGLSFTHNPRMRRCALSSITSFERDGNRWREVSYVEPAAATGTIDVGAV